MFLSTGFIFGVAALVKALPLTKRIVVSPFITSPAEDTLWTPGNDELVTWDTSAIPLTGDSQGMLVLGRQTADSENLDSDNPLAVGFSLRDGSVHITCPTVPPGKNYIVVLFGDSGNASPQFTISGVDNSEDTSPRSPEPSFIASTKTLSAPSSYTASTPWPSAVSSSTFPPSQLSTLTLTPSSPYPVLSSMSSSAVPPTPSSASTPSPFVSSSPSTSVISTSPTAGTNRNGALSRTLNAAALGSTCAGVATIMMFLL
ncbi:hypothetical protein H4582DRAFT_1925177 [Lactarius indigo]|nr:hypothetical protein H4582DRAFT_1925177 [Lactarius indigo]